MGYVLDDETLGSLGALSDAYAHLSLLQTTVRNRLGAAMAPSLERVLSKLVEFSERIDPEQPKTMKVKIAKNNYYLREVNFSEGSVNVTMTVTKVTVGARDSVFQLDMKRYKDAVVIRK